MGNSGELQDQPHKPHKLTACWTSLTRLGFSRVTDVAALDRRARGSYVLVVALDAPGSAQAGGLRVVEERSDPASAPGRWKLAAHPKPTPPPAVVLGIGALGDRELALGLYCYSGSALGGLRGRLARHLRPIKRLHWHIDYLLAVGRLAEVWVIESPDCLECLVAARLVELPGASRPVSGFGASDCRCAGHLIYLASESPAGEHLAADRC